MFQNFDFFRFVVLLVLGFGVRETHGIHSCSPEYPDCPYEEGARRYNTVCARYQYCGPESGCHSILSDAEFRRWIIDEHNHLRNNIAIGNDTRGGNGEAAAMHVLNYHVGLEYTAKCHILRCTWGHDSCRLVRGFEFVGQNLARQDAVPLKPTMVSKADISHHLHNFYEEIQFTTTETIDKFPDDNHKIGHFTQLVADATFYVGCWRSYDDKGKNFLGCNYGPAGNLLGGAAYARGTPCSKCQNKAKCNAKYKGLCGEVDEARYSTSPVDGGSEAPYKGILLCLVLGIALRGI